MQFTRRDLFIGGTALASAASFGGSAEAQTRAETLRQVTGNSVNTLDPTMPGSTREAFGISVNVYDRLVSFGRKRSGAGWVFDPDTITGELAERVVSSADGTTFTFHLKRDARFHDGSPVTAEDVKRSLDRHVSARSTAAPQRQTGGWNGSDQVNE